MKFTYKEMPSLRPIPIKTKGKKGIDKVITWLMSSREWELSEDWFFTIDGVEFVIPKGFVTNGASIPRVFWNLVHPTGLLLLASIIHDYGYTNPEGIKSLSDNSENLRGDRAFWDMILHDVFNDTNDMQFLAKIVYYSVRLFGKSNYHS